MAKGGRIARPSRSIAKSRTHTVGAGVSATTATAGVAGATGAAAFFLGAAFFLAVTFLAAGFLAAVFLGAAFFAAAVFLAAGFLATAFFLGAAFFAFAMVQAPVLEVFEDRFDCFTIVAPMSHSSAVAEVQGSESGNLICLPRLTTAPTGVVVRSVLTLSHDARGATGVCAEFLLTGERGPRRRPI